MGTVKASGSLSLEEDVLTNLPAAAPNDGSSVVGSVAVSMSDFYDSVAGGVPSSGTISFSDFYNVNNQYAVASMEAVSYDEAEMPEALVLLPIQKPGSRFL